MIRILRCFDLLQAHVIVARLRADGIDAQVFDADFVRQNWFRMLAYGGFRIVVPEQSAEAARTILQHYRDGALALGADAAGDPACRCPRCLREDSREDPQPRRNVFLAYIAWSIATSIALMQWSPTEFDLVLLLAAQLGAGLSLPWLILRYFKWRLRCAGCGHRWRAAPLNRFADLARANAEAENAT